MGKMDYLATKLGVDNAESWDIDFRCLLWTKGIIGDDKVGASTDLTVLDGKDTALRVQLLLNIENVHKHAGAVSRAQTGIAAYNYLKDASQKKCKVTQDIIIDQFRALSMRGDEDITAWHWPRAWRASEAQSLKTNWPRSL